MSLSLRRSIDEISTLLGISSPVIVTYVEQRWIIPVDPEHWMFDEDDVSRIQLILDLKEIFGVNDEAIDVILHLVDQLKYLELRLSR